MVLIVPLSAPEEGLFKDLLKDVSTATEVALRSVLPRGEGVESRLWACMEYSCMAGGKRLRPLLVRLGYTLAGGKQAAMCDLVGAAVEMMHTYSLMQDDLPCMDNDDLRRGVPTAHKKFDEYTAILASDGLQTGAFAVLAGLEVSADVRVELVRLLAHAAGAHGLVAGQAIDMRWEREPMAVDLAALSRMNALKTGVLIETSLLMGAVLAGAGQPLLAALSAYGQALGRAFQVHDDVLDVTGTAEQLGKTAGKDAAAGKTTFVSLLGLDGAKARAAEEAGMALDALHVFGTEAEPLRLLARYTVTRAH